jgi:hypothetical protein
VEATGQGVFTLRGEPRYEREWEESREEDIEFLEP